MPKIALGHPFLKQDSIKPMLSGLDFKKCVKQENDMLARGATPDNGAEGDDSANFSDQGIEKIEIRGELLLTKEYFKKQ